MKQNLNLFDQQDALKPLPEKVRPLSLSTFIGQSQILNRIKNMKELPHLILWGPPGSGKTTLAGILSQEFGYDLFKFNAVLEGVPELRKLIDSLLTEKKHFKKNCILFIDEIHRFNKSQQDALLPYLENGSFILIGATTEYPQTALNRALLSRVSTLELISHSESDLIKILKRALEFEDNKIDDEIIEIISKFSNGDARVALLNLEKILQLKNIPSIEGIKSIIGRHSQSYDKNQNRHYDVISAFIKSIRGSDPNAALLWLAVMIHGGEDPDFIARRLIILASEDIGLADPNALTLATSTHYAIKNIGMPEARIILAQTTTYLALAPKSNSTYLAIDRAIEYVENNPTIQVPTHLCNHHPDKKNYLYPHDYENHYIKQTYTQIPQTFYVNGNLGVEEKLNSLHNKIINEKNHK
jgi:putative ATPase